jgi:hypothetical protein
MHQPPAFLPFSVISLDYGYDPQMLRVCSLATHHLYRAMAWLGEPLADQWRNPVRLPKSG